MIRTVTVHFFSNYGDEVDFVAPPGHYVEAEALGIVTQELGTSFSAVFIDAAAAMVLSVDEDLTPDEVKQRLADTAVSYEDLAYHDGFHAVEEYDYSDPYGTYKKTVVEGDCENEELFYGCGMPQILSAMNITEQNEAVEFSVSSVTYHNEFEVTLTAGENCDVYYTTNETYPSENNATLYTEPITISFTTSIRAVVFSDSKSKSNAKACEYKMEYYADESDFEITSDGLITDYKGKLTEFIVPDTINSITVTGVADYAFDCDNSIIGIVLPDTAAIIGEMAFVSSTLEYFTEKGITHVYDLGLSSEYLLLSDTPNLEYLGFGGLCDAELRTINFSKLTYADELAFYNM
ncbi:MAG: chitobiase/beta-hexosaminidase C-terminal domain-containing protein [Clostridiales bacterium]|nr:chitobiase/beta-hexosaminidase C-terminal domain-containing protein [Clostridiales bacterium]